MLFEIRWGNNTAKSNALKRHAEDRVEHALRHHRQHFTRVDVHLHDENGEKGGERDKRCVIEARPRGAGPLSVDARGDDVYRTVDASAAKLERAVQRWIERHRSH